MGWFNYKDTNLLLCDEGLDSFNRFLRDLNHLYEQAFERGVSLEEFTALLKVSLGAADESVFRDLEARKIVDVKLKTAKRKKYQAFERGDVFAVPLRCGGFAYGRVLHLTEVKSFMLVELFAYYSEAKKFSPSIVRAGRLAPPLGELQSMLKGWEWEVVGNCQEELDDPAALDIAIGRPGDYYLVSADKMHLFMKDRPVSDAEADRHGKLEFQTAGGRAKGIEKLLRERGLIQPRRPES